MLYVSVFLNNPIRVITNDEHNKFSSNKEIMDVFSGSRRIALW